MMADLFDELDSKKKEAAAAQVRASGGDLFDELNINTGDEQPNLISSPQSSQDVAAQIPTGIAGVTEAKFSQAPAYQEPTLGQKALGAGEAALSAVTGATTGALGFAGGALRGIGEEIVSGQYGKGIAEKRASEGASALTYAPRTQAGQEYIKDIGEAASNLAALGPIGAELGGASQIQIKAVPKIQQLSSRLRTGGAKKLLQQSAPTIEGLKEASRGIYNELDDFGAFINPSRFNRLSSELRTVVEKEGFNKRLHQNVSAVLDEFDLNKGKKLTVSNLDTLRKVALSASKSTELDESRLGSILVGKIDDAMDNLGPNDFIGVDKASIPEIGAKYKDARQLWQRARKSEMIEDIFEKAKNQASGFENGLRVQFRSVLNNKKLSRGFTDEELSAMKLIVRGGPAENVAKAIGKFGFTEGQASNMLLGSLGVAGGAAVGGGAGAVAVPLIGQVSKTLAQKLTVNNANMANLIVRAGKNHRAIINAYVRNVKPAERSAIELSELLLKNDVDLAKARVTARSLPINERNLALDAIYFAGVMQSNQNDRDLIRGAEK